jgi:hypothetical protein
MSFLFRTSLYSYEYVLLMLSIIYNKSGSFQNDRYNLDYNLIRDTMQASILQKFAVYCTDSKVLGNIIRIFPSLHLKNIFAHRFLTTNF